MPEPYAVRYNPDGTRRVYQKKADYEGYKRTMGATFERRNIGRGLS